MQKYFHFQLLETSLEVESKRNFPDNHRHNILNFCKILIWFEIATGKVVFGN